MNFKGGKGIATSFGVLLCFSAISGILFVIGIIIIAITRYVSLASITAAFAAGTVDNMGYDWGIVLYGLFLGGLALLRHKAIFPFAVRQGTQAGRTVESTVGEF